MNFYSYHPLLVSHSNEFQRKISEHNVFEHFRNFMKIDAGGDRSLLANVKTCSSLAYIFFCLIRMKLGKRNAHNNVLSDCKFNENRRLEILLEVINEFIFLPPLISFPF